VLDKLACLLGRGLFVLLLCSRAQSVGLADDGFTLMPMVYWSVWRARKARLGSRKRKGELWSDR